MKPRRLPSRPRRWARWIALTAVNAFVAVAMLPARGLDIDQPC